jgi:type II secretory pathway component PulF
MDVQTVQAGEMAGTLALSLRHLADSVDQTSRLRKQVLSALIYPVLVSVMALVVLGLIIAFVLPRFEAVFASLLQGQALPWYTLALFQAGQFLRSYGVVVLLILGLGVLILGLFFQLLPHQARRLALHLPLIGSLLHSWFATQFTHHFAMLLQAGVPLIPALEHSADRSVVQPIVHALKQGALPSQALAKFPQAPDLLVQLALVGEQTGELAKMMTQTSQILREHFQQRLFTLTRLLEPALILALALLVGVVMSALFVPLLSLISQMARA